MLMLPCLLEPLPELFYQRGDVSVGRAGVTTWRIRRYLCFAFALTGLLGLLVRCPFGCLGNRNKKKSEDDKEAEKQPADSFRHNKAVTQQLPAAAAAVTVGTQTDA